MTDVVILGETVVVRLVTYEFLEERHTRVLRSALPELLLIPKLTFQYVGTNKLS